MPDTSKASRRTPAGSTSAEWGDNRYKGRGGWGWGWGWFGAWGVGAGEGGGDAGAPYSGAGRLTSGVSADPHACHSRGEPRPARQHTAQRDSASGAGTHPAGAAALALTGRYGPSTASEWRPGAPSRPERSGQSGRRTAWSRPSAGSRRLGEGAHAPGGGVRVERGATGGCRPPQHRIWPSSRGDHPV